MPAFAVSEEAVAAQTHDVYAEGFVEIVDIGGTNYTFTYYYTPEGNRAASITNDFDSMQEVVIYDTANSTVYLNDEIIGTVTTNKLVKASPQASRAASDGWTFTPSTGEVYGPYTTPLVL